MFSSPGSWIEIFLLRPWLCPPQICSHGGLESEEASEWQEWRGSPSTTTQESGYGSLGFRETEEAEETDLDQASPSTLTWFSQQTQTVSQSVSQTVTLEMNFPVQDVVDHQAEDVARLNQEISCLREEIERGDRQIKELEQQVTDISSLMEMWLMPSPPPPPPPPPQSHDSSGSGRWEVGGATYLCFNLGWD